MTNLTIQAMIAKSREHFRQAEPAKTMGNVNRKVPDGSYTGILKLIEFAEVGKHPAIRFTYEITDADKKTHESAIGEIVEVRYLLDTEEGPSFIKRDFGRFGYDDIDNLLDDMDVTQQFFQTVSGLNAVCKIAVAMSDDDQWQNVYLNSVLEMDEISVLEMEEDIIPQVETPPVVKKEKVKSLQKQTKVNEMNELLKETTKKSKSKSVKEEVEKEEEVIEEEEVVVEEEETGELQINAVVQVEFRGSIVTGKVTQIDESTDTVVVKIMTTGKQIRVKSEKIQLIE